MGVFNATAKCLWAYDQLDFVTQAQQRVPVANSIVDFHLLVDDEVVAVVEAKSPSVMNALREMLPQRGFELSWTKRSPNLVSRIFSNVGI
jgi:alpha-D-ribose 1-methylphosphonate 5-triphosphate synthase subunit PhnL